MSTTHYEIDGQTSCSRRQFLHSSSVALGGLGSLSFASVVPNQMATAAVSSRKRTEVSNLNRQERQTLRGLVSKGLLYAVENQFGFGEQRGAHSSVRGLIADRQRNFMPLETADKASTSATGMGLIALAIACTEDYRLITKADAIARVTLAIKTALSLPHEAGIGPHFVGYDGNLDGWDDRFATVDFAWLIAGALTAAKLLQSSQVEDLAMQLCHRVDWLHWVDGSDNRGLLRHGRGRNKKWLPSRWNRANAETLLMYVLAIGHEEHALPVSVLKNLDTRRVNVHGLALASGDTALFTRQWALRLLSPQLLLDASRLTQINFQTEEEKAVMVDREVCHELVDRFPTFKTFNGISSGDGPGDKDASGVMRPSDYREYRLTGLIDGTAHPEALACSIETSPQVVFSVIEAAQSRAWQKMVEGRYGLSTVNVGHEAGQHRVPGINKRVWRGPDMVGIDVLMATIAMDNMLTDGRIPNAFRQTACMMRAGECMRRAV